LRGQQRLCSASTSLARLTQERTAFPFNRGQRTWRAAPCRKKKPLPYGWLRFQDGW